MTRHQPQRRMPECDRLALYAAYREVRGEHAPPECNTGTQCWVRDGPPALSPNGSHGSRCLGCDGSPRARFTRQWWPLR